MLKKTRLFNYKMYELQTVVKTKKEANDYASRHLRGVFYRITKVADGYAIYEFMRKVTHRF